MHSKHLRNICSAENFFLPKGTTDKEISMCLSCNEKKCNGSCQKVEIKKQEYKYEITFEDGKEINGTIKVKSVNEMFDKLINKKKIKSFRFIKL